MQQCLEQNKQVTYDLLSSHGDTENMIFFAMIMQGRPSKDLLSPACCPFQNFEPILFCKSISFLKSEFT